MIIEQMKPEDYAKYSIPLKEWTVIATPPAPTWACRLFRRYGGGYPIVVQTDAPPNRFHRWMQKVCFGHEWVRL